MTHTLWSHDVLLGTAELSPLPSGDGALTGELLPEPAFDAVWPTIRSFLDATAAAIPVFAQIPTGLRGDEISERLRAAVDLASIVAAREAVVALGLTVRDASGRVLDHVEPSVTELGVSVLPTLEADEREFLARALGDQARYALVVIPRP